MLSLYGNIYSEITADPTVLREVVKGGNLKKEEKAKITKKLTSRLTRSGQMNFDDFQQWFTKTCEDIQSFRKLKSKYGSSRKK